MNTNMEGDYKMKSNKEDDNYSSPLRITSQAKANMESIDSQNNDFENGKTEGNPKHDDNEEGHNTDVAEAIGNNSGLNKIEMTLTQLLRDNDELLNAKDNLLEDKNKLLRDQNKLLKCHDKVFGTKDRLIESQEVVIEQQNQLVKDLEKRLAKNGTGIDGVVKTVVPKNTSKRRKKKPKPISSRDDESRVEKIELLETKIKILEAILETVVGNVTGGEQEHAENETLPDALERLSAHPIFAGRI